MAGDGPIRDLDRLLADMEPSLNGSLAGFTVVPNLTAALGRWPEAAIIGTFREAEGLSVILDLAHPAAQGADISFKAAWITLTVHSDLEAVGLTAAFATSLGEAEISCNVIAALHHDHIFVPEADGQKAMAVLRDLQQKAARKS